MKQHSPHLHRRRSRTTTNWISTHKNTWRITGCVAATLLVWLLLGVPPPQRDNNHSSFRSNTKKRLALIIPYAASKNNQLTYWNVFCKGAAGIATVADVLIFHTESIETLGISDYCWNTPNIYFISLPSERTMAKRLLRVLDKDNNSNHPEDLSELTELLTSFIQYHPYGLVEFKPALGHIFADYLDAYSHWGYTDLDILWGDLERWITEDEWNDYDIVSYGYGDQQRLYVRGQFTFHRNTDKVNQIWRACDYLSHLDVRFRKILEQKEPFRTESAEGCYSAAILQRNDLRVKYAVKAWTDTQDDGGQLTKMGEMNPKEHFDANLGVYLTNSSRTGRQVIYQLRGEAEAQEVFPMNPSWFDLDSTYNDLDMPLQKQVGAMEKLEWKPHPQGDKCMYWVLPKYQSKICIGSPVAADETVYWIDGQLFKQQHENVYLPIQTRPFFHFQEWKRHYRYGQLASVSSDVPTVLLTDRGVLPVTSHLQQGKRTFGSTQCPSPLDVSKWKTFLARDRSRLPDKSYCLAFATDDDNKSGKASCQTSVSWRQNTTDVLLAAPGWSYVQCQVDVTLTLTLHLTTASAWKERLNLLERNLKQWEGQPIVAILAVSGADARPRLQHYVQHWTTRFPNVLLAAVYHTDDDTVVSRKALLNMCMDAVPTRWYVTGLELERGLLLSSGAHYIATQLIQVAGGSIFYIPQFDLDHDNSPDMELLMKDPTYGTGQRMEHISGKCESQDRTSLAELLHVSWGHNTMVVFNPPEDRRFASERAAERTAEDRFIAQDLLSERSGHESSMMSQNESPVYLLDNAVPDGGALKSNDLVRELEELVGPTCYNGLRFALLVTLGYRVNVAPGVFAASSTKTRRDIGCEEAERHRCQEGCVVGAKQKKGVVRQEILRIADIAMLGIAGENRKGEYG